MFPTGAFHELKYNHNWLQLWHSTHALPFQTCFPRLPCMLRYVCYSGHGISQDLKIDMITLLSDWSTSLAINKGCWEQTSVWSTGSEKEAMGSDSSTSFILQQTTWVFTSWKRSDLPSPGDRVWMNWVRPGNQIPIGWVGVPNWMIPI